MDGKDTEKVLRVLSHEELKIVVKTAIKEWLDEQALKFGKWTLRWLAMSALGGVVYFILVTKGWTHK